MNATARRAVCAALVLCLLLVPGGVAMACCCCPCCHGGSMQPPDRQEMEKRLGEKLNALVSDGTITADQSAQIQNFFQEKGKQRQGPPPDMAADLEKHLGLSASQAKTVADALRPPGPPPFHR